MYNFSLAYLLAVLLSFRLLLTDVLLALISGSLVTASLSPLLLSLGRIRGRRQANRICRSTRWTSTKVSQEEGFSVAGMEGVIIEARHEQC